MELSFAFDISNPNHFVHSAFHGLGFGESPRFVIFFFSLFFLLEKKVVIGGFVLFFVRDPEIWFISGAVEVSFFLMYGLKCLYFKCTKQPILLIRLNEAK